MTVASPTRAVLDAFASGDHSFHEIAARTGMSQDMVRSVVDQLVRMGLLKQESLSSGCPTDGTGCGSCADSAAGGGSCATGPADSRGPVLFQLTVPPRR